MAFKIGFGHFNSHETHMKMYGDSVSLESVESLEGPRVVTQICTLTEPELVNDGTEINRNG